MQVSLGYVCYKQCMNGLPQCTFQVFGEGMGNLRYSVSSVSKVDFIHCEQLLTNPNFVED